MSNATLQQSAVSQLAAQADVIGKVAQDSGAFAALVAAFDSNDPDAFGWVLQRLEMLPQCELICEWIRIKRCVLRCVEVCGPPDPQVSVPGLRPFADAIIRLASDRALLNRVVDAVSCGDAETYRAAIAGPNWEISAICCAATSARQSTGASARSYARRGLGQCGRRTPHLISGRMPRRFSAS